MRVIELQEQQQRNQDLPYWQLYHIARRQTESTPLGGGNARKNITTHLSESYTLQSSSLQFHAQPQGESNRNLICKQHQQLHHNRKQQEHHHNCNNVKIREKISTQDCGISPTTRSKGDKSRYRK
jgi:hypothetical protein